MRSSLLIFIIVSILCPVFVLAEPPAERKIIENQHEKIRKEIEDPSSSVIGNLFSMLDSNKKNTQSITLKLDGSSIQRVNSYDQPDKGLQLFGGDEIKYFINGKSYSKNGSDKIKPILLILKSQNGEKRFPMLINGNFNSITIPGSSHEPMEAFIENLYKLRGYHIKIFFTSIDRDWARNKFKYVVLKTPLSSSARISYKETSVERLRLRSEPNLNGKILMQLRKGSIIKIIEEKNGWYNVRLPDGSVGWLSIQYVRDIL